MTTTKETVKEYLVMKYLKTTEQILKENNLKYSKVDVIELEEIEE